jgi:two-component system nitrogen regulation response regulator NtrX
LVATAIHRLSSRAALPFVAVNCAAVPETLIESELFGHIEGAFTGARRSRRGSFEQAMGGTLFLDEIGDMSLMTQAKVLRALETGEIRRIGAEGISHVDFRLIAATNRDLLKDVDEGNFRKDLYYRLSVLTVRVPPLRQRREDIPALVGHFVRLHAARNGVSARPVTRAAVLLLSEYDWPGNVRELSNVVERLIVLSEGPAIDAREVRSALQSRGDTVDDAHAASLRTARDRFEREFLVSSLAAHGWRIQETAEAIGINRSHLWKKMKTLRIELPDAD